MADTEEQQTGGEEQQQQLTTSEPSGEQQAAEPAAEPAPEPAPNSQPQAEGEQQEASQESQSAAAGESEQSTQQEGSGTTPTEGEQDQEEKQEEQQEQKVEEEEEVEITPEGSPHWLSTEDVQARRVPESEVENYKNFHFKQAYGLRTWCESLKEHTFQTEFLTISSEEVDVLLAASHPSQAEPPELSEEQQQVLNRLEERLNQAIQLYEEDGAFIKLNDRSPTDAILERNDATFIAGVRDAVINELEVEKQSANAYAIWKEKEEGFIRRGIKSIRRSFRRPRSDSARRPKLEEATDSGEGEKKEEGEEKKEGGEEKKEGEGEGEKKEGEGEQPAAEAQEGEAAAEQQQVEGTGSEEPAGQTLTVEATLEGTQSGEQGEQQQPEVPAEQQPEPAAEEQQPAPPAEEQQPEPPAEEQQEQEGGEGKSGEEKQEGEKSTEGQEEKTEEKTGEGEGEIQEVGKETGKDEEPKKKSESKIDETHATRKVKTEPTDNQVLRAFARAIGSRYRVANGKEALDLLLRSVRVKQDLTQIKAFGTMEDVQVTLSVRRWQPQIPRYPGMEFRGFVYKGELNALSQSDDTTYYPSVAQYKMTIQHKVQGFFNEYVKGALQEHDNYIIDFFVAPDKVYVIQLNPFYTGVGACLYTWREHAKLFVKGPYEFRIVESSKTAPECFHSLQADWQSMLESVLQQKQNERRQSRVTCVLL